ncbi:MAG: hypothetical protein NVSMB52_05280 [Chloroflexota bacterium]
MKLLLIDGYNLLYRSFTSLPPAIVAADGLPIHAVYGLITTILRLIREHGSDGVIVAYDVPDTPTFRHKLYPLYQGQRGPLGGENAPDFERQVRISQSVLPKVGVTVVQMAGFEADDILGTIALQMRGTGKNVVIVSTDRDLLQIVCPGIEVLALGTPPRVARTEADVRARLGVKPALVPDFKALAGDPSDNIPGVPGIGVKTAAALINEWNDLDGIYDNLAGLSIRVRTTLETHRDNAMLFRRIATIVTDPPIVLGTLPTLGVSGDSKVRAILQEAGH